MSMNSRSLPPATPEESARIDRAKSAGCICCRLLGIVTDERPEYHHFLHSGLRVGHRYGVALCKWHHQSQCGRGYNYDAMLRGYGPGLRDHKGDFHARFGTDQALLNFQDDLLGLARVEIPSRRQLRLEHGYKRPEREKPVRRKASATSRPAKLLPPRWNRYDAESSN